MRWRIGVDLLMGTRSRVPLGSNVGLLFSMGWKLGGRTGVEDWGTGVGRQAHGVGNEGITVVQRVRDTRDEKSTRRGGMLNWDVTDCSEREWLSASGRRVQSGC